MDAALEERWTDDLETMFSELTHPKTGRSPGPGPPAELWLTEQNTVINDAVDQNVIHPRCAFEVDFKVDFV